MAWRLELAAVERRETSDAAAVCEYAFVLAADLSLVRQFRAV